MPPYYLKIFISHCTICSRYGSYGYRRKILPKSIFPFSSLILIILATWILYKSDNKNLSELGFNTQLRNISLLFLGLIIGLFAFTFATYLRSLHSGAEFHINWEANWQLMLMGLYYLLPMVAVEEFLFRGYLFKKTISISSVVIANSIFAIIFMLIHVLDESVLQSPGRIVMLVIAIPISHLFFATALLKSKTIFFPIGYIWVTTGQHNIYWWAIKVRPHFFIPLTIQTTKLGRHF